MDRHLDLAGLWDPNADLEPKWKWGGGLNLAARKLQLQGCLRALAAERLTRAKALTQLGTSPLAGPVGMIFSRARRGAR